MTNNIQTSAIMSAGMRVLRETLGVIETEIFITTIKQEHFDYTQWRRNNLFENMTIEELIKNAAEYEKLNPDSIPLNAELV